VGAADLLQAPLEVFELNLALPIAQLASQVRPPSITCCFVSVQGHSQTSMLHSAWLRLLQIMYYSVGPSAQQLAHGTTVKWLSSPTSQENVYLHLFAVCISQCFALACLCEGNMLSYGMVDVSWLFFRQHQKLRHAISVMHR